MMANRPAPLGFIQTSPPPASGAAEVAAVDMEAPATSLFERAAADTLVTPLLAAAPGQPPPQYGDRLSAMVSHLAQAGAGLALATGSALLSQQIMRPWGPSFGRLLLPPAIFGAMAHRCRPNPACSEVGQVRIVLAAGAAMGIWLSPELGCAGSARLIGAMLTAFTMGSTLGILATVGPWLDHQVRPVTQITAATMLLMLPLTAVDRVLQQLTNRQHGVDVVKVRKISAFPVAATLAIVLPHYLMQVQARHAGGARSPWPRPCVQLALLASLLATCVSWVSWPPAARAHLS